MRFYLIGGALVLASLAGILIIVARKFPQLTLIDAEALPLERDAKRKKEIIHERAMRMSGAFGRRLAAALTRLFDRYREGFRAQYRKLLALERQYRREQLLDPASVRERIAELKGEAERYAKAEEFGEAERRYIEIVSLDQRDRDAYRGLGKLAMATKKYAHAAETFAFLVKMTRRDARCTHAESGAEPAGRPCRATPAAHGDIAAQYLDLGLAAQGAGNGPLAHAAFARAVAFEPANPRHLDLLLDACILEGDKAGARATLERLRAANPENQKLSALEERIAALPDPPEPPPKKEKAKSRP